MTGLDAVLDQLADAVAARLAEQIKAHLPAPPPLGELLTVDEVASRMKYSPSAIHDFIRRGIIPSVRVTPDSPLRVRAAALDELERAWEQDGRMGPCHDAPQPLQRAQKTAGRQLRRIEPR